MKVGDYVRTKKGTIYQFNSTSSKALSGAKKYMVKSSPNIIDLIEVGDYVNGKRVNRVIHEDICGDELLDYQHIFVGDKEIYEEDIKSIITKEQFLKMEYKVGE